MTTRAFLLLTLLHTSQHSTRNAGSSATSACNGAPGWPRPNGRALSTRPGEQGPKSDRSTGTGKSSRLPGIRPPDERRHGASHCHLSLPGGVWWTHPETVPLRAAIIRHPGGQGCMTQRQCPGQPGKPVLQVVCRASGRFAGAGQRVLRPALPAADHREGAHAVWTFRLPQNAAGRRPERWSCGQPGWRQAGFVFVVARDSGRESAGLIAVLKMHR